MTDQIQDIQIIETTAGRDEMIIAAAEALLEAAGTNPAQKGDAVNAISTMLFELNNPAKAESFASYFAKKYKVTKKSFTDQIKLLVDFAKLAAPKHKARTFSEDGTEEDTSRDKGWYESDNCYFFHVKDGPPVRGSNFIIKPLFHIYSKTDNKRLVEITNRFGYSKIMAIPSKNFISVEQFQAYVFNEGAFIFNAGKAQYIKVLEHIANDFPRCNEIHTLGWQREGFYAFANGIWNGRWQPVDTYGITEHKENHYFSPAFSKVYDDVREDDDEYENDRFFVWNPSPISFGEWTRLMISVYGDNAITAIAFAIATTFRELIYSKFKIFPHLFLFGEKQSGKSQLAWSLSNLFFHNMPAFNLNSGTQVGFFRRLSRVKNAIVWLDEYGNEIDPKRFQALKAAYDGIGHEKGKMTQDNRTMITKINGSCCISSQWLPTLDDNALHTRSCLLTILKQKYNAHQTKQLDILKGHEEKGISSLVGDILQFRGAIDESYGPTFSSIMDKMKVDLIKENLPFDERLVRNFTCLLAPVKVILNAENPLKLNFTYEQLYNLCKANIAEMAKQISQSESISHFWKTVEYLLDDGKIQDKVDLKVATVNSVIITEKNETELSVPFPEPQKLLFIRLSRVHPLYMERHRQQTGKTGIDMVSIMHYFKSHKAFVGHVPRVRFDTSVSTAYAFKYGPGFLDVNLERMTKDTFVPEPVPDVNSKPPAPAQIIIDLETEPPF